MTTILHGDVFITILETIEKLDYHPTKTQLWHALPKPVKEEVFNGVLDHLIDMQEILICEDNTLARNLSKQAEAIKLLEKFSTEQTTKENRE